MDADQEHKEQTVLPPAPLPQVSVSSIVSRNPFQSLENLVNALLMSGLAEKYVEMAKAARPVKEGGGWNHDDVTVLLKLGDVAAKFMTKLNRAASQRRRSGIPDTIEDTERKIATLQEELRTKREQIDAAKRAWKSGGVNRLTG